MAKMAYWLLTRSETGAVASEAAISVTLMYDTAVCALDFSECGDGACILGAFDCQAASSASLLTAHLM